MGSKRSYHHGDLEKALVQEGLAQVRARGHMAVSLRQVAQTLGVSPSAAYAHFPDKRALMAAVGTAGTALLDERVLAAADLVDPDPDRAAVTRLDATLRAYAGFAMAEPHLFRHVFGPYCTDPGGTDLGALPEVSTSFGVLCSCLDDLDARGLLRPGARPGLEVLAWTTVHGFASLVLDGFLPASAGEQLVDTLAHLALADDAPRAGR